MARDLVRFRHPRARPVLPDLRKPRRKRKLALALGASAAGLTAAIADFAPSVAYSAELPPEMRRSAGLLNTSTELKAALIEEEGVRLTVHADPVGNPTVGVGHLVTPTDGLTMGERISMDRALDLLNADLALAEDAVERLLGDLPVNQHEFDALVDLVFNVGEGGVSQSQSPRLNAAIAAHDYDAIVEELSYGSASGQELRGLALRSERRTAIFEQANYEDPRDGGRTSQATLA